MPSRLGVHLLALLVPALVFLPAAAHAEKVVTEDAIGDVFTADNIFATADQEAVAGDEVDGAAGEVDEVINPDNTTSDITRTVVAHGAHRLRVTASFRDLRDTFGESLFLRVRTPRRVFNIHVERRGKHTLTMLDVRSELKCRGLLTTADSKADTISITVPTTCIDDPRWVRVGLVVIGMQVTHDPDAGDLVSASVDDAHLAGWNDNDNLALGPEVGRG